METIDNLNLAAALDCLISLATAFFLGGLIGFERQSRQRSAGLKTNVLVAVGAAVFVNMAGHLYGHEGAIRVGAYVVSGIGFLGAGVIMREGGSVVGLSSAATLWCSAAIGTCAGGGLVLESVIATGFILAANILLRPIVDATNRRPIALAELEGVCVICLIVDRQKSREGLALLKSEMGEKGYDMQRLDMFPFGNEELKIEVLIDTTIATAHGLDELVDNISNASIVHHAFWSRGISQF